MNIFEKIKGKLDSLNINNRPKIIFVCGLGGSGKTTFCQNLSKSIGSNCTSFHTDWYATYPTLDRKERIKKAHESGNLEEIEREENPKNWYSWNILKRDLKNLSKSGEIIIKDAWNQKTGKKNIDINLKLEDKNNAIILCDGIYLFHPAIKNFSDLIISLHIPNKLCLERAKIRDGYRNDPEYLEYKQSLMKKYDLPYYEQYEQNADIMIDNSDYKNPVIINDLFGQIICKIKKRKSQHHPFVLGICGIERSGKTEFAKKLSSFLKGSDYKIQILHLDDFLNPKNIRYVGKDLAKTYFENSFDLNKLVNSILMPIHDKKSFEVQLTLLNYDTDKLEIEKKYTFDKNTIVIIEGVFLYRKEIAPYIDYKIFLDISFDESIKRAKERDVPIYGEEVLKISDTRYFPAQREYLSQYPPGKLADIIINYNDIDNPIYLNVVL